MNSIIKFKFKQSSSINFKEAIKLANKFDNLISIDEKTFELEIVKNELFAKWEYFSQLHHYITRWAGTQVWIDGILIAPYKNDKFYKIQDIRNCYKSYETSYDKENYCWQDGKFKGWGCIFIKSIKKNIIGDLWSSGKYWYKFGHFIDSSIWKIDKHKIEEIIINESALKCLNICPCFSTSNIKSTVNKLPDLIDLKKDKGWQIIYAKNFNGSSFINEPIEIEHNFNLLESEPSSNTKLKNNDNQMEKIINTPIEKLSDEQINKLIEHMKNRKNNS